MSGMSLWSRWKFQRKFFFMKDKQLQILEKSLELVPFDGWSDSTMRQATKECGMDENYAKILFPEGVGQLVDFFMRQIDEQMLLVFSEKKIDTMRVRDRISFAVRTRLEICSEYKPTIKQTVSFYAMPQNVLRATKTLWKTVDSIWYAAGDDASDFNHYTKRVSLAAVYSSTLLYWLNDTPDHENTWQFLDRRIGNVMQFHKAKSNAVEMLKRVF